MLPKVLRIFAVGLFSFAFVLITYADQASYQAVVKAEPSLLGYWPLEGNLNDASGKGNHGTTVGNAGAITFIDGVKGGKAAMFDNTSSTGNYVNIESPFGSMYDTKAFTTETWVKMATRDDGWNSIFDRNSLWYMELEYKPEAIGGSGGHAVVIRIYDPANPTKGGSDQVRDDVNVAVPPDASWHYLAMTYDSAKLVGYIDGNLALSKDYALGVGPIAGVTPATPPHNNYNLTLAGWQQRDDWYDGGMDEVAYYGEALDAAAIKRHYDTMFAEGAAVEAQGKLATTWGKIKTR